MRAAAKIGKDVDLSSHWSAIVESEEPFDLVHLAGDGPVELDIGCGKGLFLIRESQNRPNARFVGIEVSKKFSRMAAAKLAKRGIANARVLCADVRKLLPRLAAASIQAAHVYFPDPWWKRRHRDRRIVNTPFVIEIARILNSTGKLLCATDVEEYYQAIVKTIEESGLFERIGDPAPSAPENDLDYLTNFERKYRKEGRCVYRASYVKK